MPERGDVTQAGGVQIRPARGCDAAAIRPLIERHAAYEGGVATVSIDALRSALDQRPPLLLAWVAERDHVPIGYAAATLDFSTWACRHFLHLDCLFVDAQARGAGIGAALLATVRRHALALGVDELQWQTPDWNAQAIRFYRREGATALLKMRFTLRTNLSGDTAVLAVPPVRTQ